ncbi:MAG: hypothetical protein EOP04_06105 [Proteobacteria bacterium]|nr:MAG: hypothetical protein EOP04_06105 [Pseudomonadota bacterium]
MKTLPLLLITTLIACDSPKPTANSNDANGQGRSCLTNSLLACSPIFEPRERSDIILACTESSTLSTDGSSLVTMECQVPDQDPRLDYQFSLGFTQIPEYKSFDLDTSGFSYAFQLEKSSDPRFIAQSIPMSPLPNHKTVSFRYKVNPSKTLEEACKAAITANDAYHAEAKSYDKTCSVRDDCTELSRLNEPGGCLSDTIAFHFDPSAADSQSYIAAVLHYCPVSSVGNGSQYCESGASPPKQHYTRCMNNQCVVEFESEIPMVKKD